MYNKILFLGVNPDGTEVCSNYNLFRYKTGLDRLIKMDEKYKVFVDNEGGWCNTYSEGYYTVPKFNGVQLPKGTINKLTGKTLTWEDEPFMIDILSGFCVVNANKI